MPVSPAKSKNFGKAFVITLIVAVLLAAFIVLIFLGIIEFSIKNSRSNRAEGKGYESPKACAEAYMEYMKNADYSGMLSCYAIESVVEHYDIINFVERMRDIIPTYIFVSNEDEFSTEISCDQFRGRVCGIIKNGVWYLAGSDLKQAA